MYQGNLISCNLHGYNRITGNPKGAEYLVFVSSRSLKTREKYTN